MQKRGNHMKWWSWLLPLTVLACGGSGEENELVANGLGEGGAAPAVTAEEGAIEGPDFQGGAWTVGSCGEELFLDVGAYAGPGADYPMPVLGIACSDDTRVVTSNGIPHYTYQSMTPNGLSEQNFTWEVPLNPVVAVETSAIPCLGSVGYTINGIPVYGPNEGPFPDPYGDPIANGVMDWCLGHTGGDADYHYHGILETCMAIEATESASPVLGFALDGFPIYGPRGCLDEACEDVVTFVSGWDADGATAIGCTSDSECSDDRVCAAAMVAGELVEACVAKDYAWDNHTFTAKDGSEFLDECNGRVGPDGTYRYHTTSTFPYVLGCYRGSATSSGAAMGSGLCPSN